MTACGIIKCFHYICIHSYIFSSDIFYNCFIINFKTMKTRHIFTILVCMIAGALYAQTNLSTNKNAVYVVSPILAKSDKTSEQKTFAAMRAPIIKKLNENPKVMAMENQNCGHKLLTVIQNYRNTVITMACCTDDLTGYAYLLKKISAFRTGNSRCQRLIYRCICEPASCK